MIAETSGVAPTEAERESSMPRSVPALRGTPEWTYAVDRATAFRTVLQADRVLHVGFVRVVDYAVGDSALLHGIPLGRPLGLAMCVYLELAVASVPRLGFVRVTRSCFVLLAGDGERALHVWHYAMTPSGERSIRNTERRVLV